MPNEKLSKLNALFDGKKLVGGSAQTRVCVVCWKERGKEEPPFALCGGCKKLSYCSRECQKKNWKSHRPACLETKANVEDRKLRSLTKTQQELRIIKENQENLVAFVDAHMLLFEESFAAASFTFPSRDCAQSVLEVELDKNPHDTGNLANLFLIKNCTLLTIADGTLSPGGPLAEYCHSIRPGLESDLFRLNIDGLLGLLMVNFTYGAECSLLRPIVLMRSSCRFTESPLSWRAYLNYWITSGYAFRDTNEHCRPGVYKKVKGHWVWESKKLEGEHPFQLPGETWFNAEDVLRMERQKAVTRFQSRGQEIMPQP